jgi:RNA polymerase sigma factor (sigma-70 family)
MDDVPEGADDALERLDEALTVHAALDRLSPECHEILDRFFCRDESYRTIGAELELPSGTIASRIARCLTRLRDVIGPRETEEGRKPESSASGGQVGQR